MVYTVAATMPKLTCSAQHGSTKHKQWQTPGVTLEHSMLWETLLDSAMVHAEPA